jgi:hypothetical protein
MYFYDVYNKECIYQYAGTGLGDGERVVDEVVGSGAPREVGCVGLSAAHVFLKNVIGNCRCYLLSC